jgi:hypothetical protein
MYWWGTVSLPLPNRVPPRTLRHRRADRIIVSLSHVPNQIRVLE